jgi:hypothetical protein
LRGRLCPLPGSGPAGEKERYARDDKAIGSSELADTLEARSGEVEAMMSGVPGMQGYFLMRTVDGCAAITICDDEAGTDESTRLAGEWIRDHAADLQVAAPEISSGPVLVHTGAAARA